MQVPLEVTDQLFYSSAGNPTRSRTSNSAWKNPFELTSSSSSAGGVDVGVGVGRTTKTKTNERNDHDDMHTHRRRRTPKTKSTKKKERGTSTSTATTINSLSSNHTECITTSSPTNTDTKTKTSKENKSSSKKKKNRHLDDLNSSACTSSYSDSNNNNNMFHSVADDDDDNNNDDAHGNIRDEAAISSLSLMETSFAVNEHKHDSIENLRDPKTTRKDGRPRSAYDKNAEWYCSSDGDDDMNGSSIFSGGSSILSLFQPKKKQTRSKDAGLSDTSMDFSTLMKASSGENISSMLQSENSMEFFNIQKNNDNGSSSIRIDSSIDICYSKTISAMHSESLQSVPVSQLMNPNSNERIDFAAVDIEDIEKSAKEGKDADDVFASDLDSDDSMTRVQETKHSSISSAGASIFGDNNNNEANNENENEQSFFDKINTEENVRLAAIGTIALLILDVILLCLFLIA